MNRWALFTMCRCDKTMLYQT